jgi:hypothetical protein
MPPGQSRHRLCPFEGGALALVVKGRFSPRRENIQALLGLAVRTRILAVHVDAVRAAVDLRDAHSDELEQRLRQAAAS